MSTQNQKENQDYFVRLIHQSTNNTAARKHKAAGPW
jgi:hypothetical protein